MGIIKTKGIVINTANLKDNDKILTVLTPDLGKISVIVKGAKKTNSVNMSASQLLTFSDLLLYNNASELYILNSAEIIEMFYNLRNNIEKIYYAMFMCKIMQHVSEEEDNTYELLQLLLNALYLLDKNEKDDMFIVTVFQIRLLRILGFMPKISKCINCDNTQLHSFSISKNGALCSKCLNIDRGAIEFSEDMFNSLKYILLSESKKVFSFSVSEKVLNELKLFIKLYLSEKLEKEYDINKFMQSLG